MAARSQRKKKRVDRRKAAIARLVRSLHMARIGTRNTAPEQAVRRWLRQRQVKYSTNVRTLPGSPDVVLPHYKRAIFVHGCFWHGHPCARGRRPSVRQRFWNQKLNRNKVRDRRAQSSLRRRGWYVSTIWACSIPSGLTRLARALGRSQRLSTTK